ncbi:type VI secretion system tip protein VgrG [Herbaspirillum seropedicae]|uniref:VGR-related protein n=1 Tax=Herbaspirillum seropedicae (strain SmR1) TaxID=757424 RepID=D8IV57_HERSS|nr:type VI secretion system Vgr family protein [Herbaspirillum seropedicae]ADJ61776.1 VGR-related protein [Herbaspirillum seropedicae SmR1]AKN63971.1 type IV secretion protein Rhs [Herbaspirillum seropedicae]NQE29346.1 type IV secretion protein Rhs [Herbaspirillum seropedicae]UMU19886.1 type VI secretion system tip protein VgrG [Herbaspirillum seropedicae]
MTDHFATITAAFASAILSQNLRPIRLRWGPQEQRFEQSLLLQRVDIQETLLEGMQVQLTCVSTDPDLPLHTLLGQPLGVEMVTDRGRLHHTNGLITDACAGHADGALRVYQLTMRDALSIMEGRVNTRIFRRLSVPSILEILLSEWRQRSSTLAAAFKFDLDGLDDTRYPAREISHQFNESDAHFIRRLCRREGIAWYVASGQQADETAIATHADIPIHTLVFCDQPALLPRAAAGTVRYHRDGATEERDAISAWSRQRSLVPGSVWRRSWDYKAVRAEEASSHSIVDQGDAGYKLANILRDGLIEAPHAADSQNDHLRLADTRMLAHEARSESFDASGTVRDLAVGHWFLLDGHPDMRGQKPAQREFLVTSLQQQAENNFPTVLQDAIRRLAPASPWKNLAHSAADLRYRNQLTCRRRTAPLAPHYDPRLHLPPVHPITALVVGPSKEEVYCDELGRIKVQLQGLHPEDHAHAQGAGASGHEQDSAFVRVSSAWAGAGYGHDAVPRVGMEVLIDFLGGDPDKMFVAGVLHNGINLPARFSHSGSLPGNRFLSGIKTKEIGGARYNQLRLDDSPGQISTQLASEHQHSQLNLGYLTEPRHGGRGEDRGEGLEARTDGHGVMRAAKGVMITAQSQDRGRGRMLERAALLETLDNLQELAQRLSHDAARHHAEATDVAQLERIRAQLRAWDAGDVANGAVRAETPMVAVDAPAGVSITSQDTMVLGAAQHIDLVSRANTQLSAGRRLLMRAGEMLSAFAAKHMKLISGKGSIKIQAHEEHIDLSAARRILLEASEEIILQAPKISIRSRETTEVAGGGSFSRWNASAIEHGTSGEWRQQAAMHHVLGPANCPPPDIPPPPTYEELQQSSSLMVRLRSHARDGRLLAHQPYTLFKQGEQIAVGVTDAAGQLRIKDHQPGDDSYSVRLSNGYHFDLPVQEELGDLDHQLAASGYRSAETDSESRLRHAGA